MWEAHDYQTIKTEHGDPTLSFYYYSSKYFRHRTKCRKRKKKRKLGKFLMLEICLKIRKMSAKKLIFGSLVTMATTSKKKSWLKQFFSLGAKKCHTLAKSAYYIGFSWSLHLWILFWLNKLRNYSLKIDHKLTRNTL